MIDTDRTIATVAGEINVGAQLLGRWVQQERDRIGAPPEAPLDASERAELERLRRENTELWLDNEFLVKAAAFFAAKNTLVLAVDSRCQVPANSAGDREVDISVLSRMTARTDTKWML